MVKDQKRVKPTIIYYPQKNARKITQLILPNSCTTKTKHFNDTSRVGEPLIFTMYLIIKTAILQSSLIPSKNRTSQRRKRIQLRRYTHHTLCKHQQNHEHE